MVAVPWQFRAVRLRPAAAGLRRTRSSLRFALAPSEGCVHKKCRFTNARPDPDFRYFSKAMAVFSRGKAKYATRIQGRNFAVWGDRPPQDTTRDFARLLQQAKIEAGLLRRGTLDAKFEV